MAITIATAGLAVLPAGCGRSPRSHVAQVGSTSTQRLSSSTTSVRPAQQSAALPSQLAFSQCMRSHGVSNFPDPDPQGQYPPFHSDSATAKQATLSANDACKSLLGTGGLGTPQNRQEKFAFALKVAGCLRADGYPNFPDPTVSSQGTSQNLSAAGVDPNSPQFQAVETACEKRTRQALGLS